MREPEFETMAIQKQSSQMNLIRITKEKEEFQKGYLKGKWPEFFKTGE